MNKKKMNNEIKKLIHKINKWQKGSQQWARNMWGRSQIRCLLQGWCSLHVYCNKAYGYRNSCASQWTPQILWGAYVSGTYSVFQMLCRMGGKKKKKKSIWLC